MYSRISKHQKRRYVEPKQRTAPIPPKLEKLHVKHDDAEDIEKSIQEWVESNAATCRSLMLKENLVTKP